MGRGGGHQEAALQRVAGSQTLRFDTDPFSFERWTEDRIPWLYISTIDLLLVGRGGSNHGAVYEALEGWLDSRGVQWDWEHCEDGDFLQLGGARVGRADQGDVLGVLQCHRASERSCMFPSERS